MSMCFPGWSLAVGPVPPEPCGRLLRLHISSMSPSGGFDKPLHSLASIARSLDKLSSRDEPTGERLADGLFYLFRCRPCLGRVQDRSAGGGQTNAVADDHLEWSK